MNEMKKTAFHKQTTAGSVEQGGLGGALSRLMRLFGGDVDGMPNEPKMQQVGEVAKPEPVPAPRQGGADAQDRSASLSRTFDVLHTPVLVLGDRLVVQCANDEARHVFGEQIKGRSFSLFFRDPKIIDEIESTFRDGQSRQVDVSIDVPLKRQYRMRTTRLSPQDGQPVQVVLEFQETTLIRRSESMRSEFVANVSHELRSPLATLIGFIETLKEDGEDTDTRERFLDIMEGESQRMRRLIDDLLSLTNVELHEHERPRARLSIKDLLEEVIDSLTPRARAQGLEIHFSTPADLPDTMGERDQLIQVFHNLLTNAIKYGADGTRVEIVAETMANGLPDGGASIEVSVRDFGQGIEPEHLPRLTERFYRVDKGRSRAMGGTGLGLAIVKHIVNRHRGRFHVESELGHGSVFKVRLPVYREEAQGKMETNL